MYSFNTLKITERVAIFNGSVYQMPLLPSSFFTYFVYFDFFPCSLFTFAVLPYPVKSSLLKFDQTSDENVLQSFICVLTIKLKIFWSWDKFVLEEGDAVVFFFWLNHYIFGFTSMGPGYVLLYPPKPPKNYFLCCLNLRNEVNLDIN